MGCVTLGRHDRVSILQCSDMCEALSNRFIKSQQECDQNATNSNAMALLSTVWLIRWSASKECLDSWLKRGISQRECNEQDVYQLLFNFSNFIYIYQCVPKCFRRFVSIIKRSMFCLFAKNMINRRHEHWCIVWMNVMISNNTINLDI